MELKSQSNRPIKLITSFKAHPDGAAPDVCWMQLNVNSTENTVSLALM
jgi:hypothetical protein